MNKGKITVRGRVWKQISFEEYQTLPNENTAQFVPDNRLDEPIFFRLVKGIVNSKLTHKTGVKK